MYLPKPSEGGTFELAPAGTHIAICYRFIDRGTQMTEYMGERKTRREIMLTWELCNEMMSDGRPFSASKTYTWSMNEKATLRKDLEAWRGKSFVDDDFEGPNAFNTKKLLGAPCMLSIIHETKNDRTFAKVSSIGKLTRGVTVPPLVNAQAYLALCQDGWNPEAFSNLSEKMREIISASPEYKELTQQFARHDDPGAGRSSYDFNDDIPF
jgi:hypothetical protein